MGEAHILVSAEDRASSIIDHVSKKLGIFNSQGIAMGLGFAAINKGIDLAMQGFQALVDYIQKGVEMNREFELSMIQLNNSMSGFSEKTEEMKALSVMFGVDLNTVTTGLRAFSQEGYNASDSLKMFFSTEMLAISMGEDYVSTQNAVSTTMDIFGYNAKSAGYVTEEFNRLIENTGLSLSDINTILGGTSDEIRNSGISFDTLVDVLHTLKEEGGNTKEILSDLKDVLGDLDNFSIDAADSVESLVNKFGRINDAASMSALQIEAVRKISQMDLSKGMDIGSFFDENKVQTAINQVNMLRDAGVSTLEDFNEAYSKIDWLTDFWLGLDTIKGKTGVVGISEDAEILNLTRAFIYWNEMVDSLNTDDATTSFKTLEDELSVLIDKSVDFSDKLQVVKDSIKSNNDNIAEWTNQLRKTVLLQPLNEDLRYMNMGLIDVSYASKINNRATRDLVVSISMQQDAIDNLNRSNKIYALEANKNSLEIMRIQYAAFDQRRGLTRGQEKLIKDLEKANMGLRIDTMENQQQIDEAQLDLDPLQERLEKTKLWYNEEIYTIQDAYNLEIKALTDRIDAEQLLLTDNLANAKSINALILQNEIDTYNARKAIWAKNPEEAKAANIPKANLASLSPLGQINAIRDNMFHNIPRLQSGGSISRTGLAVVHEGETVIPANHTINPVVNITINNPVVSNQMTADKLAKTLRHAMSKGLIDTTGKTISRMR